MIVMTMTMTMITMMMLVNIDKDTCGQRAPECIQLFSLHLKSSSTRIVNLLITIVDRSTIKSAKDFSKS